MLTTLLTPVTQVNISFYIFVLTDMTYVNNLSMMGEFKDRIRMIQPMAVETLCLADLKCGKTTPEKLQDIILKYVEKEEYEVAEGILNAIDTFNK